MSELGVPNMCVPLLPVNPEQSYTALYCFVAVAFAIAMFDIYLDLRQRQTYKIVDLPAEFTEGYNLSDEIDRKLKKGQYAPAPAGEIIEVSKYTLERQATQRD
jgi:hypothetical protein